MLEYVTDDDVVNVNCWWHGLKGRESVDVMDSKTTSASVGGSDLIRFDTRAAAVLGILQPFDQVARGVAHVEDRRVRETNSLMA